ncbi:hypothetical protein LZC95_02640 [Pendulispora brunnea]|uniref:Uncharacterized protein n=1 Tax=Pendulispora brunnea TaxID=2905690 RepID=A0ABZ2KE04_9BACT
MMSRSEGAHAKVRLVLRALAPIFVCAALFHVYRVVAPVPDEPTWRHALFIGLNLLIAAGLWYEPRRLLVPFGLLTAQQLMSHGGSLYTVWHMEHAIDWPSIGVLVLMPVVFVLLLRLRQ